MGSGTLCSSWWYILFGGWYLMFQLEVPYVMVYGTSISFASNFSVEQLKSILVSHGCYVSIRNLQNLSDNISLYNSPNKLRINLNTLIIWVAVNRKKREGTQPSDIENVAENKPAIKQCKNIKQIIKFLQSKHHTITVKNNAYNIYDCLN